MQAHTAEHLLGRSEQAGPVTWRVCNLLFLWKIRAFCLCWWTVNTCTELNQKVITVYSRYLIMILRDISLKWKLQETVVYCKMWVPCSHHVSCCQLRPSFFSWMSPSSQLTDFQNIWMTQETFQHLHVLTPDSECHSRMVVYIFIHM